MKKKINKFPNKKISETFLDFAFPLIDTIGKDITKHHVEQVLQIAYTVWNAIVIDAVKGNNDYVSMIRETMMEDPMSSSMIEQMISRKKEIFSGDLRMIGEYRVFQKNGEWRLRADARDPSTIK